MGIIVLFLVHAALGGFQLAGMLAGGIRIMTVLSWIMAGLIAVHAVIGGILTVRTLKAQKKAGVSYPAENKLFWTRRISGAAVMMFILLHIAVFVGKNSDGVFRLTLFDGAALAGQILLVLSAALHAVTNIKPLMLSLGVKSYKEFALDLLMILSVILLLAGTGFVIYYKRWSVF